jgi:hypothetical protein
MRACVTARTELLRGVSTIWPFFDAWIVSVAIGLNAILGNDCDDPSGRRARAVFRHRSNHSREEHSIQRQRHSLAAVLGKTETSRFFQISRFDRVQGAPLSSCREERAYIRLR